MTESLNVAPSNGHVLVCLAAASRYHGITRLFTGPTAAPPLRRRVSRCNDWEQWDVIHNSMLYLLTYDEQLIGQ